MIEVVMKPGGIKEDDLDKIDYPVLGSPKLDGIRAVVTPEGVLSSTLKRIPNKHIQRCLSRPEYVGLDGELIVGNPADKDAFNNSTGPVRKIDGRPDFKLWVFDSFVDMEKPFVDRLFCNQTAELVEALPFTEMVEQKELYSKEEVLEFTKEKIAEGFEGSVIRSPWGIYKQGRSSKREQIMFKIKPVADDEAEIIGYFEQVEGKTGRLKDTLGGFRCRSKRFKNEFSVGTGQGLTKVLRQELWDRRDELIGKMIVYKFQEYGSLDAPRQPIFKGFREKWDITEGY